jgi:hypothetical protein
MVHNGHAAGGASAEPVWTTSAPWGTTTSSSSSSSSSHNKKGLSSSHLLLQNVTQDWPHGDSTTTAISSSSSVASDMAFVYPVLEPCTADGKCLLIILLYCLKLYVLKALLAAY